MNLHNIQVRVVLLCRVEKKEDFGRQRYPADKKDVGVLEIEYPPGFIQVQRGEAISKQGDLRDIPVLFLTSLDRYNLKIKGLEMGAEDYIVKPYNKAEVLARVKSALRRSERYKRDESSMEGNLADMSLAEILQALDIGRKTACIHLKERGGTMCVNAGNIVLARWRDFTARDAVVRLFFVEKGAFSVTFGTSGEEVAHAPLPIQKTVFETVAYVDELRAMMSGKYPPDSMIEIREGGASGLDAYKKLMPMRLSDLVAVMEGDLKENVLKITAALEKKQAVIVN